MQATLYAAGLALLVAAGPHHPPFEAPPPKDSTYKPLPRQNVVPGVAPWAKTSLDHRYGGYYVGGGVGGSHHTYSQGDARYPDEGTWGMDFVGHWLPHRVVLKWWHGRKYQGGVGSYYPEYPKHLYNPLANPPPKENSPAYIPSESEQHGNGHGNGHANGHAAEHPNGHKPEPAKGAPPERKHEPMR